MGRGVHVPVHDRRGAAQSEPVGGLDDVLPGVGGKLPLRQDPPHVVVQDLGGRSRDGPQTAVDALLEELAEGDAEPGGAVEDLHGAERVDVDPRDPGLDGVEDAEVEVTRKAGMKPALDADLGGAVVRSLLGPIGHLVQRERVGLGIDLALGEGTEAAARVADVGEVDVPVDHIGDLVADGLGPQLIGHPNQRLQLLTPSLEQDQGIALRELAPVPIGGLGQRGPDLGAQPLGRAA